MSTAARETTGTRWSRDAARCVRRSGMVRLCAATQGSPHTTIALVDGAPVLAHPSLRGAAVEVSGIERVTRSANADVASAHATFIASMFVGTRVGALGLCPACPLLVAAAVDDDMLRPGADPVAVAHRIAHALGECARRGAQVIQLSLELGFGSSPAARTVSASIASCVAKGIVVVIAAGHGALQHANHLLWAPGVVPVSAADEAGDVLWDERWGAMMALHGLAAPGTHIPGAVLPDGIGLRDGSSYAASFVSAAIALQVSARPWLTAAEAASALLYSRPAVVSVGRPPYLNADHSFRRLES